MQTALAGKARIPIPYKPGTFVAQVSAGKVTLTFNLNGADAPRLQVDLESGNFSNPVIDRSGLSGSSQNETINTPGYYKWRMLDGSSTDGTVKHFEVVQ